MDDVRRGGPEQRTLHPGPRVGGDCYEARRAVLEVSPDAAGGVDRIANDFAISVWYLTAPRFYEVFDISAGICVIPIEALASLLPYGRRGILDHGEDGESPVERSGPGGGEWENLFGRFGAVDAAHDPGHRERLRPAPRARRPSGVVR